jgi:hypothetical protein
MVQGCWSYDSGGEFWPLIYMTYRIKTNEGPYLLHLETNGGQCSFVGLASW